jgi:hypothetical protein
MFAFRPPFSGWETPEALEISRIEVPEKPCFAKNAFRCSKNRRRSFFYTALDPLRGEKVTPHI